MYILLVFHPKAEVSFNAEDLHKWRDSWEFKTLALTRGAHRTAGGDLQAGSQSFTTYDESDLVD